MVKVFALLSFTARCAGFATTSSTPSSMPGINVAGNGIISGLAVQDVGQALFGAGASARGSGKVTLKFSYQPPAGARTGDGGLLPASTT